MKHKQIWLMLLATIAVGLVLPLGIGFLMAQNLGVAPGLVMIFMLCLGWPGYSLWLSVSACRDIWRRWFLPLLFSLLLVCTCGAWLGWLWPIGVFACGAMLLISVIVMFVTVSSGTKE